MGNATAPKQIVLVRSDFPPGPAFDALVTAINQFSVQTVQAINQAQTVYRELSISTGAVPADSFPIDLQSPGFTPQEVRVAKGGSIPTWTLLATGGVRILGLSGLAPNSSYTFRLAMD